MTVSLFRCPAVRQASRARNRQLAAVNQLLKSTAGLWG